MKKIVLTILVIILILISVLFINVVRMDNHQLSPQTFSPPDIDEQSLLERFSQALTYKTISYDDPSAIDSTEFFAFLNFIEESFPLVHQNFERKLISNLTPLFYWQGSNPDLEPVLFMGHYDVVPVDSTDIDNWEAAPFSGEISNGFIWGRGTLDNKNTVMGLLETAELLLKNGHQPQRSVYFSFGHDEEIGGMTGARNVANYLEEKGVRLHMVLDEGGLVMMENPIAPKPVALVGIAEKGYVSYELIARAEGGHSSRPLPDNSITILSKAILALNGNQMSGRLDGATRQMLDAIGSELPFATRLAYANRWLFNPIMVNQLLGSAESAALIRTTTAPTIIRAGVKDNVLPIESRAVVNFRILPGDSYEDIEAHISSVVNDERVTFLRYETIQTPPSVVSPVDTDLFRTLHQTIMNRFQDIYVAPYLVIGATDSRHFSNLTENIYRFSPVMLDNTGLARMHGTNERIDTESYLGSIGFYYELIQKVTAN